MKKIYVLVSLILISCGPKISQRAELIVSKVVGGQDVDPLKTDVSFMVSIGGDCGATIIHPKWLLTAAHCVPVFDGPITAGGVDLDSKDRIRLRMKRFVLHPDYSGETASHDFALIELLNPIDFQKTKLSALELSNNDFVARGGLNEGHMATVFGWGHRFEMYNPDSILQMVQVPLVSREVANQEDSYDGKINETMIAAGYREGKKDACVGDSGGPLVIRDRDYNINRLIGIVSWGEGCARPNFYGVYSNVAYAYNWIIKTISEVD